jgi:antitoxin (DNA-binding transcriptional repressor) of toxin-antitoxin stability system
MVTGAMGIGGVERIPLKLAHDRLPELVSMAEGGYTIIITKQGRPAAYLTPPQDIRVVAPHKRWWTGWRPFLRHMALR